MQELTRERVPLEWALTKSNLGNALRAIGERGGGTAPLEEAVVAFHEALRELTRDRVPRQWALVQSFLGTTLERLGEQTSDTVQLEEAIAAFREASKELTREQRAVPLGHAPDRSRHCVPSAWQGGRRDGAARRGCRGVSRSFAGNTPPARAAQMGRNPEQSWQGAGKKSGVALLL